jgi:hypothetical protein
MDEDAVMCPYCGLVWLGDEVPKMCVWVDVLRVKPLRKREVRRLPPFTHVLGRLLLYSTLLYYRTGRRS